MEPQSNQPISPPPPPAPPTPPTVIGPEYEVNSHNEIENTKRFSKKIVALILFVIALLIPAALYFYSQNMNTKTYDSTLATPIPTISPTSTPDPTADWLTYADPDLGYSIKYPKNYSVFRGADIVKRDSPQIGIPFNFTKIATEEASNNFVALKAVGSASAAIASDSLTYTAKDVNGLPFKQYQTHLDYAVIADCDATGYVYQTPDFTFNMFTCDKDTAVFNQMISSLKFTAAPSPTASSGATACTQEAKQCPDGSFVTRVGTKCEFAECPTQ